MRIAVIGAGVSGIDARHARERLTPHVDEAALEAAARREHAVRRSARP